MKKALILLALAAPSSLFAQQRTLLSSYVSTDGSVSGSPVLVGAMLTREQGWVAVRLGGSVDARSTLLGARPAPGGHAGVYGGDLDGLLFAGSPARSEVVPYALVGLGGRVVRGEGGVVVAASWSYGAGVRNPVTPWLSLEGEARHREPMTPGALPAEVASGWEFRFGATVRLTTTGGERALPPAPPVIRSAPAPAAGSAAAARRRVAVAALDTADDYLGTPYRWGGNTPQEGFDCSGFVRFVFRRQGIELPRVSRDQARAGTALPLDVAALEPGDLIAFASRNGVVDHIAIYAGEGKIIHSSASGRGVRVDDLYSQRGRWYLTHMVAARRVIDVPWSFSER